MALGPQIPQSCGKRMLIEPRADSKMDEAGPALDLRLWKESCPRGLAVLGALDPDRRRRSCVVLVKKASTPSIRDNLPGGSGLTSASVTADGSPGGSPQEHGRGPSRPRICGSCGVNINRMHWSGATFTGDG